ncbi:hypothetical protein ACQP2F_30650 [Actinoplanes sp. CA-030573]|uniref:hypothetical protein n=1 Tax=Actinoplanes sp. CA-030573 TaxID=3239898 RepID=UPI003D901F0C
MTSTVDVMRWTIDGTIGRALWIGGGQWAGKTTVAGLLTDRFGLIHYHYDFHDSRGHEDRRLASRVRRGDCAPGDIEPDGEAAWIGRSPAEMADQALRGFPERFEWVLDDLRGIVTPHTVIADGWGLRPELVARVTDPRRMVVLVPTDEWRRHQARTLPRARRVGQRVSDPERANRTRIERDRLIAADVVLKAEAEGVRIIEVDGVLPADEIAGLVADYFAPFLP